MNVKKLNKNSIWLVFLYIFLSEFYLIFFGSGQINLVLCNIPISVIFYVVLKRDDNSQAFNDTNTRILELLIGVICGVSMMSVMIKTFATYELPIETEDVIMCYLLQMIMQVPILLILKKINQMIQT